jgi:vacuolar-type H+-ATPase subunit H
MIKEANTFDNRLKKMGLEIKIDDLLDNKEEEIKKQKRKIYGDDERGHEDMAQRLLNDYKDIKDDGEELIDYRTLGLEELDSKQIL